MATDNTNEREGTRNIIYFAAELTESFIRRDHRIDHSEYQVLEEIFNVGAPYAVDPFIFLEELNEPRYQPRDLLVDCNQDGRIIRLKIPRLKRRIPKSLLTLHSLAEVRMNCSDMVSIPDYIPYGFGRSLKNLSRLEINLGSSHFLHNEISKLPNLQSLDVYADNHIVIPESLYRLNRLHTIGLHFAEANTAGGSVSFPTSFGRLPQLKTMRFSNLSHVFLGCNCFPRIETLAMDDNSARSLPNFRRKLPNLKAFGKRYYENRRFSNLSDEIGHFVTLERLDLSMTKITGLPRAIGKLKRLKVLDLSHSNITGPLEEIHPLCNLEELDLSYTRITKLPQAIRDLENLRILNLCRTQIAESLDGIDHLAKLERLDLGRTKFTKLPRPICKLKCLRVLSLKGSPVTELPDEIGDLINLQRLDLRITPLRALPLSINNYLKKLRVLLLNDEILNDHSESGLEAISNLIDDLPWLGCLGYGFVANENYNSETPETLSFIPRGLMCNRFKAGIDSLKVKDRLAFPVAMWPLVLEHANHLVRPYKYPHTYNSEFFCWCCGCGTFGQSSFAQSDAIFKLLKTYGPNIAAGRQARRTFHEEYASSQNLSCCCSYFW